MAKEKYNKYKNSTVSWLGEIPEHWEIRRIKYVFQELDLRSETGKEDLLSVSQYTGVTKKSDKVAEGESVSNAKTLEGYKIVEKGNLVINIMLAWNGSLGISKYNGIVSPAYCVYKNLIGDERYFGYLFKTKNAKQEFKKQSTGIIDSRLRMYTDSFFNIKTALPPKQEQTTIANFLDYKTEKINRFTTKKKRLIELLNEQKAAVINQAVTKGINPNVPMKDSGIEWLGEIPEHWEVKPLKYIANSVLGKMLCKEDKGGYKKRFYLKSKNIQWLKADTSDVDEMWFSEKEMKIYRLEKDDLVMSEGGEVGKTCLWENQLEECYIQNSAHKVTIMNDGLPKFYLYLFFIYGNKGGFESIVNRVSIAHLTKDKLINVKCLVPPKQEQQKIVNYVETETQKIDKTISTIEKEIALVEEYKTALIAEAVTGKIDIRDFKVPTQETPLAMVAEEAANYNKR